ncbi:MAG: DUF4124 domain-containing protein [Halieaceae bacterium]|nr:DUF4124 domain-containing protein [Halieaceae bacterium]
MNELTRTCLAITALIVVTAAGSAHAGSTYYRWQDDRGNPVHSDRPPPQGTPYEVITTGSSLVRQVDADEGAVPATTEPSVSNDFQPVNTSKAPVKKSPEQCQRARENLETLNTKNRIQIRNDQGELRPLSEEEKEIQRQQAMDVIAVHCEP